MSGRYVCICLRLRDVATHMRVPSHFRCTVCIAPNHLWVTCCPLTYGSDIHPCRYTCHLSSTMSYRQSQDFTCMLHAPARAAPAMYIVRFSTSHKAIAQIPTPKLLSRCGISHTEKSRSPRMDESFHVPSNLVRITLELGK